MKKLWIIAVSLGLFGVATSANAYPDKEDATAQKGRKQPDIFKKYDKNANGVLDDSEKEALRKDFASHGKGPLKRLDRNKDGKLDDTELAALKPTAKAKKKNKEK